MALIRIFISKIFWKFLSRERKSKLLRKVPCFQHILLNNFRRVVWSMKIILWRASYFRHSHSIQVAAWNYKASLAKWLSVRLRTKSFWVRVQLQSLRKPHCKNIKWKYIKNESQKSYLGSNECRAMFCAPIFACPAEKTRKLRAMKLNLSRPVYGLRKSPFSAFCW